MTLSADERAAIEARDAADFESVSRLAERHLANDAPVPPSWQAVVDRHALRAALVAAETALAEAIAARDALADDEQSAHEALVAAEAREKALAEALEHIHFTAHGSRCYTPAGCASRTALAAYREERERLRRWLDRYVLDGDVRMAQDLYRWLDEPNDAP